MCGICGVYGHEHAPSLTYAMLGAMQNRGEESAGIVAHDGTTLSKVMGEGSVSEVFKHKGSLDSLVGTMSSGHSRYSTAGSKAATRRDGQPITINHGEHAVSIAHNGNLYDADRKRRKYVLNLDPDASKKR